MAQRSLLSHGAVIGVHRLARRSLLSQGHPQPPSQRPSTAAPAPGAAPGGGSGGGTGARGSPAGQEEPRLPAPSPRCPAVLPQSPAAGPSRSRGPRTARPAERSPRTAALGEAPPRPLAGEGIPPARQAPGLMLAAPPAAPARPPQQPPQGKGSPVPISAGAHAGCPHGGHGQGLRGDPPVQLSKPPSLGGREDRGGTKQLGRG